MLFLFVVSTEDITISGITDTSAKIGWRIASLLIQQHYSLEYGLESDNLDHTTDTISSASDITLTDQYYSIQLIGLTRQTTYYVRVRQSVGENVITISSDVVNFTTAAPAYGKQ